MMSKSEPVPLVHQRLHHQIVAFGRQPERPGIKQARRSVQNQRCVLLVSFRQAQRHQHHDNSDRGAAAHAGEVRNGSSAVAAFGESRAAAAAFAPETHANECGMKAPGTSQPSRCAGDFQAARGEFTGPRGTAGNETGASTGCGTAGEAENGPGKPKAVLRMSTSAASHPPVRKPKLGSFSLRAAPAARGPSSCLSFGFQSPLERLTRSS